MSTTTNVNSLVINKMSSSKYGTITPVEGQMYATPDDNVVHTTGNETVGGIKTFSSDLNISGSKLTVGSGSNDTHYLEIRGKNNDNTTQAYILLHIPGVRYVRLSQKGDRDGVSVRTGDDSGYSYISCNTPASTDNSNFVATTAWVYNARSRIVAWGLLNYSALVTISSLSDGYTAPSDGVVIYNSDSQDNPTINNITIPVVGNDSGNEGSVYLPVAKGDVIKKPNSTYNPIFVPFKY